MKLYKNKHNEAVNKDVDFESIINFIEKNLVPLKLNAGTSPKDTVCWKFVSRKNIIRYKILYTEIDRIRDILKDSGYAFEETSVFEYRRGFEFIAGNKRIELGCSGGKVGSSGNGGHRFEAEFQADLQKYFKNPEDKSIKFKDAIDELLEVVRKQYNAEVVGCSHDGGDNKKRRVTLNTGKNDVDKDNEENKDNANIGSTVTDITLHLSNGKKAYLSLKVGDAKFLNKGIAPAFPQKEIMNGRITNPAGAWLLQVLGINNAWFCEVYKALAENRPKSEAIQREVKVTTASNELKGFIEEAIGYGYIMVKRENDSSNRVLIQNFVEAGYAKKEASSIKDIRVLYPEQNKQSKTISVNMKTNHYAISIVIRNRGGAGRFFPTSLDVNYRTLK